MDIRNWEMFAGTAAPVVGATVTVYEASLTHPNPGSAITSTTTNSDGMWSFTGLTDTAKDVKVQYSDRTKWYKGLTLHSVYAVKEFAEDGHTEQNFLLNGGFETNTGSSSYSPGTSLAAIFDNWQASRGSGDSATLTRVTSNTSTNSLNALQAVYTKSAGNLVISQALNALESAALRGQTISASAQVRQGAANAARLFITDGTTTTYASYSATTGSYVTSAVQNFLVSNTATSVVIGVQIEVTGTHQVDNVIANYGTSAASFVPRFTDADLTYTITEATPSQDTSPLGTLLNNLGERVKSIIGAVGADWKDAIPRTLTQLYSDVQTAQTTANTGVTNAATAQSAANAAQSTANTAVTNAAAAQSTANTAVANAATAQSTANTGVTNAATAQSTANTALANAASALARINHTGTQLASTISDFANAVLSVLAGNEYKKFKVGLYIGDGTYGRQITTGFLCSYVQIQAVNGSSKIVYRLVSTTPSLNIAISGTTTASIFAMTNVTALHASDGFVVEGTGSDVSNNSGVSYYWQAWG